jgi:hypothetical protein
MTWLARLKKMECDPEGDATKTTKRVSVVFVAPVPEPVQKTGADLGAPPEPSPGAAGPAETIPAAPKLAQVAPIDAASGNFMTDAEINAFNSRMSRFTDLGLTLPDAEKWAIKLLARDRELDDRRSCLECASLAGRVCRAAGTRRLPETVRGMEPVRCILQRCDAFLDQYVRAREPVDSTMVQEQT